MKDWDLFNVPEKEKANPYDGHTPQDVAKRLRDFLTPKPQYPKTYEECCEVLSLGENGKLYTKGYKASLIQNFHKLIICRDAYWKIAGEQMGLGKPWEPDWADTETDKYVIEIVKNTITIHGYPWNETNHLLAFPTEEMRDAFYENFKGLINETKELL